jgi:small subunit ribosomal protein S17
MAEDNEQQPEDQVEEQAEPEATAEAEPVSEEEAPSDAETAPDAEAETPAAESAAEEETAPEATTPTRKPKPKRVPRSQRRQRPKPKREQPEERKPLVRQPKPVGERGDRQERRGTVVSSAMDKTIVVRVETLKAHSRYKKIIRRSSKFHAHDERNEAQVGDVVRIVETRPVSKTKRWRLAEILEVAK